MAMVITDNSPGAGEVAWTGMVINYKGSDYTITDDNSDKKYLWWDLTSPTVLQKTDTLPVMTDDDQIVLLNVSGIHYLIPTATIYNGALIRDATITAAKLATGAGSITGEIRMWSTAVAPSTWVLCDGSAISRTTYATLFGVIGVTFGVGDNSTTFNVPNFKDNFPVGAGTTYAIADTGGEATHVLTESEMPAHVHTVEEPNGTQNVDGSGNTAAEVSHTVNSGSVGGDVAHENRPPYLAIQFIIKT